MQPVEGASERTLRVERPVAVTAAFPTTGLGRIILDGALAKAIQTVLGGSTRLVVLSLRGVLESAGGTLSTRSVCLHLGRSD